MYIDIDIDKGFFKGHIMPNESVGFSPRTSHNRMKWAGSLGLVGC